VKVSRCVRNFFKENECTTDAAQLQVAYEAAAYICVEKAAGKWISLIQSQRPHDVSNRYMTYTL
jgi:hypothetical protein